MLVFYDESNDPFYNLAAEEALLNNKTIRDSNETLIRFWSNSPTVVIGRNQNTADEINWEVIEQFGIKVVRRMTGGGAVYQDEGNLNYTFIAPVEIARSDNGRQYEKFADPVIQALRQLGVAAVLSGRNDLLIDGKKFSGNAQVSVQHRTLQHGTLLFNTNLDRMTAVLNVREEKLRANAVASVRSRVTNLLEHLPKSAEISNIQEFREFLMRTWKIAPTDVYNFQTFGNGLSGEIEKLRKEKYSTWNWNFGKSPAFNIRQKKKFYWGTLEIGLFVQRGIIREVRFYGDFFHEEEPDRITNRLIGLAYKKAIVQNALSKPFVQAVFPELQYSEFLNLLFPENIQL